MNRIIFRSLTIFLLILLISKDVLSAPNSPNSELAGLLQRLTSNATSEQYKQIAGAVSASPSLLAELNGLASSGKLTEVRVLSPEAMPMVGAIRFAASVDGTQFVLSSILLKELLKNQIIDVVKANDIFPDNTVFVLAHLAFHIKNDKDMAARVDGEMKRGHEELSKTKGIPDFTDIVLLASQMGLENEASAFIQGWNYVVDAATQSNGNRVLTAGQISTLLLNLRYRFAFAKALQLSENGIQISNTGMIELNSRNIKAIAAALRTSQMADIQ